LTTDNDIEPFPSNWFFDSDQSSSIAPFVNFIAKMVVFGFQKTEFTGGQEVMTTGGVNIGYGRIDDGRFGRTSDLGKVWE